MNRDELIEAAIRVCIEVVRMGGAIGTSETLRAAQCVTAAMATVAVDAGAHLGVAGDRKRWLACLRKRRQRARARGEEPAAGPAPSSAGHAWSRSTPAKTRDSSVTMRDSHDGGEPAGVPQVAHAQSRATPAKTRDSRVTERDIWRDPDELARAVHPSAPPDLSRSTPAKTRDSSVTDRESSRACACASDPDLDPNSSSDRNSEKREEKSQSARELERDASRVTADSAEPEEAGLAAPRAPQPEPRLVRDDVPERCRRLKAVWERVAHGGRSIGHAPGVWALLQGLLPALDAREVDEPEALFERVLQAYTRDKHRRRKQPVLAHFCADFAAVADQMALQAAAAPRSPPAARTDKLKGLVSALRDARDWRAQATDRAEHAYAGMAIARAEHELVTEFGQDALSQVYAELERAAS